MSQPIGQILQIAYVVRDLDAALAHWTRRMNAGPFFVLEHAELVDPSYRGQPTDPDLSVALGFSGGICVELIAQHDDRPSVYRDIYHGDSGGGFHHWGVASETFDADVARYRDMGHELAFGGQVAVAGRFAYMDTLAELGGMIELIEWTPAVRELFGNIEAAARDWDGRDPIRRM
jgi:hypothetical protein